MNKTITIAVADDNVIICKTLENIFEKDKYFQFKKSLKNGIEALEYIYNNQVDILILDIAMPHIDGVGVLEKLKENPPNFMPIIIILSAIQNEAITRRTFELGVKYYIMKPFDLELLGKRVKEIYGYTLNTINDFNYCDENNINFESEDEFIKDCISKVGLIPEYVGSEYFCTAIKLCILNKNLLNKITTELYPQIAIIHNTTSNSIESSMRHCLTETYKKKELKGIYYPFYKRNFTAKPTNSHFIREITTAYEKWVIHNSK